MGKIIFFDVDGTLVDYENRIPESAIRAIRTARKNGHKVYVCTAIVDWIHEKKYAKWYLGRKRRDSIIWRYRCCKWRMDFTKRSHIWACCRIYDSKEKIRE